ncbi:hypothetical protein [Mucilaginibacter sp. CAU 1740]|uniref:DUF6896 domain-containing protein n=1 Tax=Mucilaginibacter sp. CAU 1740 TaxID=3140365 RepID=UPI00325C1587
MERITQTIKINSISQIPTLQAINKIPRGEKIKLLFEQPLQDSRQEIGIKLKKDFVGFQVSIHTIQPEINIAKLITDEEIDNNQLFFEQCAKDYGILGNILINKLAVKLGVDIDPAYPLDSFSPYFAKQQFGNIEEWRYFFHGFHCGFEHKKSGQIIEVELTFGLEFGGLDPYFFTSFIKSTQQYHPLPVGIYEDHADGVRIIERMLAIKRFERIYTHDENHSGVVVRNRK